MAETKVKRVAEHQQAVLGRRTSNAAHWDRRAKGTRTRADVKRAAMRDQAHD